MTDYLRFYVLLKTILLIHVDVYLETSPLPVASALRAFEQEGSFIVPHLLRHGTSVFSVLSEELPNSVGSYETQEDVEDLF
jgi:hypothetical protein